jgi:hypothetical protein
MQTLTLKRQYEPGSCGLALGVDGGPVLVGEFFASGFASPACLVGGGVGEEGIPGCSPPGSGVAEGADDEDGFFFGMVGGTDRAVFWSGALVSPVEGPGFAESSEGDGVAASFGEEVAAESEHVCPAAQSVIIGFPAECPACVNQPFGVTSVQASVQVNGRQ